MIGSVVCMRESLGGLTKGKIVGSHPKVCFIGLGVWLESLNL